MQGPDLAETALQGSETREERKRPISFLMVSSGLKKQTEKNESVGRPENETMSHFVRVVLIDITVKVR